MTPTELSFPPGKSEPPCGARARNAEAEKLPPSLSGLLPAELDEWMHTRGFPVYRSEQTRTWLYRQYVMDIDAMKNLPRALRSALKASFCANPLVPIRRDRAGDGTLKLLLEAGDGVALETVLIPSGNRTTVCVSSQAGCPAGCVFCATAHGGFDRNLHAGEIVAQALHAARECAARPDNLVFMGMGEPFFNTEAVLKAARILNDPGGLGMGARKLTLSTCGVVPGIERLARETAQFELSVSLHAPDDALRDRLVPVNRRWPIACLLEACRRYTDRTGRIVTFEYTLVRNCNDHPEQARRLATLVRGLPCRFNLIPLSPIAEYDGRASSPETQRRFMDILRRAGINTTLRRSRGRDVDGACGQLRLRARTREKPS